ncbi:MAG: hypothetical protein FJ134_08630 [Deltaproteobacteria bacterium]|nr:hypothetical protein [Deltaproteobacteria bacterium]
MAGRKKGRWLAGWLAALLAGLLVAGCAGILAEKEYEDGHLERVRVQGGESWRLYDRNPLKEDGGAVILKKESTF